MSKPVIGVTAFRLDEDPTFPKAALNQAYITAVEKAGGIPLLIPVGVTSALLDDLMARLDGVLLTGGVDVNPAYYGAPMHPEITELDLVRDEMEIALVKWMIKEKKPFLGICRGFEVINVALGGSLYTHISDQLEDALHHPCFGLPRNLLSHSVEVEVGSRLATILGEGESWVNSLHHQGVRNLAPVLKAVAVAPDGLVEGLELEDHPFALGVQWHPEELIDQPKMLALFQALVNASVH